MQCYQHNDKSAVGTCKVCCKGLCPDCAIDTKGGLSCDQHIEKARDIELIVDSNIKCMKDAPVNMWITPVFNLILGIGFMVFAFTAPRILLFPLFMGAGFALFGIILLVRNRKIFKNK